MSLYDDIDESKAKGWNSGNMKLMQSQLQLKKAMVTQPKKEVIRRNPNNISHPIPGKPTSEFNFQTESVDQKSNYDVHHVTSTVIQPKEENMALYSGLDWDINLEYNPLHPTDYDKITRERRERRGMEIEIEEAEKKRRTLKDEAREVKSKDRTNITSTTGFAGRVNIEDDEIKDSSIVMKKNSSAGAAIAPPPSLQDSSSSTLNSSGIGVAQKIMAKYGFKEGSGLGRKEQGISAALQVEKTSGTKNRGRIINEKEMPPPLQLPLQTISKPEQTIAEIMKNPSKVIYLRNMVGPEGVDSDLEPEVREECQVKYGDVTKVIVYEIPNTSDDEAVRIFVEFKRIESAIKAVIDLNGRFFAGRQVKAGFYDVEKFLAMELNE